MAKKANIVFETERLIIRKATTSDEDVDLFFSLWTNPRVMTMVGYPQGLRITREEIKNNISKEDDTEFDKKLIIMLKDAQQAIGECKLGLPDGEGISETDVKLLPQFWGNGFGTEIKRGLVAYLFENTDCRAVQATPDQKNIASQKMQEAVGAKKIDEGVYRFPEKMKSYTCDVPYYKFRIFREDWDSR